jgi:L-asparaginase
MNADKTGVHGCSNHLKPGPIRVIRFLRVLFPFQVMQIKVFTAGGTIDKVYFDVKSQYEVGESNVQLLFKEMNVGFGYDVESILRKDSLDMTEADRMAILEKITSEPCPKILITHGTDTMIDTAKVLQQHVKDKTIVLTGAMQPALFRNSDAVFNIGCALGVLQARDSGVYIVMNGMMFDPANVRKNREAGRFEFIEDHQDF